jgi:sirohydrochlorin cobaltochelatase
VRSGLLIVAHGTRSPAGAEECRRLARTVAAARPSLPVALGNLELSDPSVADGIDALERDAAGDIVAVPLVLFAARHLKNDIPEVLAAEGRRRPAVRIHLGSHLGSAPALTAVTADRVRAVSPVGRDPETVVVLVRAGSTDPDAPHDIAAAGDRLRTGREDLTVTHAFAGIADPLLPEVLERCHRRGHRRIVVVPYLLFAGALEDRVREQAAAFGAAHPATEVVVAPRLGADARIADVVLARYDAAERTRARAVTR